MYETARDTALEILRDDGFMCAKIYVNDLARSKDITWNEAKEIMADMIASGMDCSLATF